MRVIGKYPILTLVMLLVINLLLAFFLILILADGVLKYKMGFIVITPMILFIIFTFVLTYVKYFDKKNSEFRDLYLTTSMLILGLLNILFFSFNVFCWIDLFDGRTNAILP